MNKITVFLAVSMMALSFIIPAAMQSKAEDKSFSSVIPFVATSNRIGFFDQKNGKIYMYDDNISHCIFVGQVTGLGQPIQVIAKLQ